MGGGGAGHTVFAIEWFITDKPMFCDPVGLKIMLECGLQTEGKKQA